MKMGLLTLAFVTCSQAGQEKFTLGEYKRELGRGLDEVSKRIPEKARRQIQFGLNLFIAHEGWIEGMPQHVLTKAVDAFGEAGVHRVDINPGQYPWLEQNQHAIAKYDATIERIRHHKLKLILNPQYSSVKHKVNSFEEWRKRALIIYGELARRYQPDGFVVLHEPSTMAARMNQKVTVSDWVGFVRETARVVKQNSPKTRIGAGGLASEHEYFDAFVHLPEIQVLTLNIYGIQELKLCNRMIRAAQAAGKSVYIEETWRPPHFQPQAGINLDTASLKNIGNQEFQELDSQWLRVMTAYAQANRLEAITPVWMFPLFRYVEGSGNLDDPMYNRAVVEAILGGERTTTFRTLQELVLENKSLPP